MTKNERTVVQKRGKENSRVRPITNFIGVYGIYVNGNICVQGRGSSTMDRVFIVFVPIYTLLGQVADSIGNRHVRMPYEANNGTTYAYVFHQS